MNNHNLENGTFDILKYTMGSPIFIVKYVWENPSEYKVFLRYNIGVAPITQLRTCVMKIVHVQGKSPYVFIVIFHTIRNFLKGKNSLPLGVNSFL